MDRGSSGLFYNAIGRAIFGPGVVRRSLARAPVAPRAVPAASATADQPATEPVRLQPLMTVESTTGGRTLALPPPPVPDEADGVLIPIHTETGSVESGEGTIASPAIPTGQGLTVAELQALAGVVESGPAPAPGPVSQATTEREKLAELLRDPQFRDMRTATFLAPNEDARAYLRQTFSNIFD
jgi:hypothetical protein